MNPYPSLATGKLSLPGGEPHLAEDGGHVLCPEHEFLPDDIFRRRKIYAEHSKNVFWMHVHFVARVRPHSLLILPQPLLTSGITSRCKFLSPHKR